MLNIFQLKRWQKKNMYKSVSERFCEDMWFIYTATFSDNIT